MHDGMPASEDRVVVLICLVPSQRLHAVLKQGQQVWQGLLCTLGCADRRLLAGGCCCLCRSAGSSWSVQGVNSIILVFWQALVAVRGLGRL